MGGDRNFSDTYASDWLDNEKACQLAPQTKLLNNPLVNIGLIRVASQLRHVLQYTQDAKLYVELQQLHTWLEESVVAQVE